MVVGIAIRRVFDLNDDQLSHATAVMAEAFGEDPLLVALVGGDLSLSTALFKAFIAAAIVDGEAYFAQQGSEGTVVGVACWFGPGKEFLKSPEQREAGWNEYYDGGLGEAGKIWQNETFNPRFDTLYSRCLPSPTSKVDGYHLTLLGVSPALQGQGIGGRLVREGLKRAEKAGALVCLDTYTDSNISTYKHLGFRVGGTQILTSPWGDFSMTIMVWEPELRVDDQSTVPCDRP